MHQHKCTIHGCIIHKYIGAFIGVFIGAVIGSPFIGASFKGAPTLLCLEEVYIQRVEENHIYTMLNAPCLWYTKADDTFAITSHNLGETLQK